MRIRMPLHSSLRALLVKIARAIKVSHAEVALPA
jgi:hypothetical protein